jgi:hypothetical protein
VNLRYFLDYRDNSGLNRVLIPTPTGAQAHGVHAIDIHQGPT